jgi:hypothetical protein
MRLERLGGRLKAAVAESRREYGEEPPQSVPELRERSIILVTGYGAV